MLAFEHCDRPTEAVGKADRKRRTQASHQSVHALKLLGIADRFSLDQHLAGCEESIVPQLVDQIIAFSVDLEIQTELSDDEWLNLLPERRRKYGVLGIILRVEVYLGKIPCLTGIGFKARSGKRKSDRGLS